MARAIYMIVSLSPPRSYTAISAAKDNRASGRHHHPCGFKPAGLARRYWGQIRCDRRSGEQCRASGRSTKRASPLTSGCARRDIHARMSGYPSRPAASAPLAPSRRDRRDVPTGAANATCRTGAANARMGANLSHICAELKASDLVTSTTMPNSR
jgi:hypothetical protein